jgi:hypothetical protein
MLTAILIILLIAALIASYPVWVYNPGSAYAWIPSVIIMAVVLVIVASALWNND